jgi:Protein of unknown function (DUF3551)
MKVRILITTAALLTLTVTGASAANPDVRRKWCSNQDGAMNCVYRTLARCEKTTRGEGGECVRNPRWHR